MYSDLASVYFQVHSLEVAFQDACLKISHRAGGVGLNGSLGVLNHEHSVFVVGVSNGESGLRKSVEERLLCVAVVLESLVVVKMIACQVGEKTACEF